MSLSKLESHLLKLIIPFIRIAHIPGYGQYKVKGPMITVEADVTKTLNEKILPRQQELIPEELKSTEEHENDDNNMDDMPTIDVNSVICNDEEDMPITISHAVPKEKDSQEKIDEGRTNDVETTA